MQLCGLIVLVGIAPVAEIGKQMEYTFIHDYMRKHERGFNAGSKARDDIESIFSRSGLVGIELPIEESERSEHVLIGRFVEHIRLAAAWKKALDTVASNAVFLQFPTPGHTIFLQPLLKRAKKRGARIVLLIHDVDIWRRVPSEAIPFHSKLRILIEESSVLKTADVIIAHNPQMISKLVELTQLPSSRFVNLKVFDYLVANPPNRIHQSPNLPIVIAGNLATHKAGYLANLPDDVEFNLYGNGFEDSQLPNVHYKGAFPPDVLTDQLEGSFGLVWDGPEIATCQGAYGSYLRVNNPHKVSLYLVSGLPVIVWKDAAIAEFILANGVGIAIESLAEIGPALNKLSGDAYNKMCQSASSLARKMVNGQFTIDAINNTKKILEQNS
jgi:hypothetical protein